MTTDFEDSEKWTSGPQTAQAKQKVSDVTTKHGARALHNAVYGRTYFKPSHLAMIKRVVSLLQSDPQEAIEFMRAATYSLALRYLAAADSDDLPSHSVLAGLRLATNLYQTWDKAYKDLGKNESYDYEKWLSDNDP